MQQQNRYSLILHIRRLFNRVICMYRWSYGADCNMRCFFRVFRTLQFTIEHEIMKNERDICRIAQGAV